jgi:hypothetical protein
VLELVGVNGAAGGSGFSEQAVAHSSERMIAGRENLRVGLRFGTVSTSFVVERLSFVCT